MAGSQSFDPQFFAKFQNAVVARANKSGNVTPSWADVWMALTEMSETAAIFDARGISAKGLHNDVRYTTLFGRPKGAPADISFSGTGEALNEAVAELREELEDLIAQTQRGQNADYQEAAEDIKEQMTKLIDKKIDAANKASSATKDYFKQQIVETLKKQMPISGSASTEHLGYKALQDALNMLSFRVASGASESALAQIEASFQKSQFIAPSEVVDYVLQSTSDDFLDYLQYRNGKIASETYAAPYALPNKLLIQGALLAHEQATALGVTSVEKEHMALALLTESNVVPALLHIAKFEQVSLSPQKVLRLHKEFKEKLASVAPKGERLRRVVRVSPDLKKYVADLDGQEFEGEFATIKLFARLLEDKQIVNTLKATPVFNDKEKGIDPKILDVFSVKADEFIKKAEDQDLGKEDIIAPVGGMKIPDQDYNDVISKFTTDLCQEAIDGRLDPVIGRDEEVDQIKEVLLRKGRKNPMLIGEPGTGKTALASALAQDIVGGNVPASLEGVKLVEVDMNAVMAGTSLRGELEERLKTLFEGTAERNRHSKTKTILFIDEMRFALGQGGGSGGPNIGEMLLGHLSRGDLMVMGSLTEDDFYKSIKQNGAMERRFTPVKIDEPSETETIAIIQGLKERFEDHHGVKIDEELLPTLVKKSRQYVSERFNPDNSIETLDSAMAAAAKAGEKELSMDRIVDAIAHKAKMDPESLKMSDAELYLTLDERMKKGLFGQDPAIDQIVSKLQTAKAGLRDPKEPLGKFLLVGPTGTGKTETARLLAKELFGTDKNVIHINMAEYQDAHTKSGLVGSPPGYVGHGNDGALTKAIRRTPHAVVVLDEFEKAHPDIQRLLLGVLEEGTLSDGMGMKADFSNAIILCTSNLGAGEAKYAFDTHEIEAGDHEAVDRIYKTAVQRTLAPEFINRLDGIVTYNYISEDVAGLIVRSELKKLSDRVKTHHGIELNISDKLVDKAVEEGFDPAMGGRGLKRFVQNTVADGAFARWMLEHAHEFQKGDKIEINSLMKPEPKLVKAADLKAEKKPAKKANKVQSRRKKNPRLNMG